MPRRCTICDHPKRAEIDRALIDSASGYRVIARRLGISRSALFRHKQNHLPSVVARGLEAEPVLPEADPGPPEDPAETAYAVQLARHQHDVESGQQRHAIDVVAQLRAINTACLEVLKQARSDGKHSILLRAVDRIAKQIELQAKLLGDMQDGQTVNIAIMPEWHGIRQMVTDALRPHPEAGLAVARALRDAGF